jgi:hypothetical protein
MSDFLSRLAGRTMGLTPSVQPLVTSMYAPRSTPAASQPSNLMPLDSDISGPTPLHGNANASIGTGLAPVRAWSVPHSPTAWNTHQAPEPPQGHTPTDALPDNPLAMHTEPYHEIGKDRATLAQETTPHQDLPSTLMDGYFGERDSHVGTGVSSASHTQHQNRRDSGSALSVSANHTLPASTDSVTKLPPHESLPSGPSDESQHGYFRAGDSHVETEVSSASHTQHQNHRDSGSALSVSANHPLPVSTDRVPTVPPHESLPSGPSDESQHRYFGEGGSHVETGVSSASHTQHQNRRDSGSALSVPTNHPLPVSTDRVPTVPPHESLPSGTRLSAATARYSSPQRGKLGGTTQQMRQDETPSIGTTAPSIQVTIGRIEVRATPPPPTRAPARRTTPAIMSLDDYVNQRMKGGL